MTARKNPGRAGGRAGVSIAQPAIADARPISSKRQNAFQSDRRSGGVDFSRVAAAALAQAKRIVPALLPDGRQRGREWLARNPRRADRRPGSFAVNLATGRWSDFAIEGARGGDLVSLVAYIEGMSQRRAAQALADLLGLAGGRATG